MWTKAQTSAHQRALAIAQKHEDAIARLEQIAKHNPAFAQRIADLRAMRDHLEQSARTAIAIDPEGSDQ